ncbi:MAG: hypothetical protein HY691_01560 [Chloroflexi bacterium]|nr:hypothetical protein [Chloroflexota bacterium]
MLRVAIAMVLTLAMLPLPMFGTNTAEAWDTGSGYRQDENALRTLGISAGARSILNFAGSGERTEARGITTSYFAGAVPEGTAAGGTSDITTSQISRAYLLLRDTKSERWVGLIAINSTLGGEIGDTTTHRDWNGVRGAAFSLWGTGVKDASSSNPRSSVVTAAPVAGAPFTENIIGEAVTRLITTSARRANGILTSATGDRMDDAGGTAAAIGSCACEGNSNGRSAFLTTAQVTNATTSTSAGMAGGDTLTVAWNVAFATPQVSGPVELWSAVESFQNAVGLAARLYDGWDRYATRTIGTTPFIGVSSVPTGASVGQQAGIMIEATDPESDIDAADIDVRAVSVTLVGAGGNVTLIYYHRKSDSTKISTTDDEKFQIARDDGRYSGLSDGTTISHAWLDFDQPDKVSSGDSLRVTFRVTFKEAARGQTFTVYGRVLDREYNDSGLVRVGTVRVQ